MCHAGALSSCQRLYNNLYIGAQDALDGCYPRLEDDGINTYNQQELDVFFERSPTMQHSGSLRMRCLLERDRGWSKCKHCKV